MDSDSDKQQTEQTSRKNLRCGPIDNLIALCPKPPKHNKKLQKTACFVERGNHISQKDPENGDYDNNQNKYAFMACLSGNDQNSSRNFGDSSQLTNWILYLGATCHMTHQVLDFIPGSL